MLSLAKRLNGWLLLLTKGAIDSGEDKGIEMRVRRFARAGIVILRKESNPPFECCKRVIVLDLMSQALCLFDTFTVVNASLRPVFRMAAGVEFVESGMMTRRAHDDVFSVTFGFLTGVERSAGIFEGVAQTDIADVRRLQGGVRKR